MKKKLWIIAGIAFAGLVVGTVLIALVLGKDEALNDDSDLVPHYLSLPDVESNPFPLFADKIKFEELDDDEKVVFALPYQERTGEQWQMVRDYLKRNKESLELGRLAIEQEGWKNTMVEYSFDTLMVESDAICKLARSMKIQAELYRYEGKIDLAVSEALAVIRLGKRYESAGGGMIDGLVVLAIIKMGESLVFELIKSEQLGMVQIERIESILEQSEPEPEKFADCFRVEYQLIKSTVEDLAGGDLSEDLAREIGFGGWVINNGYVFKPHQTINECGDTIRILISDLNVDVANAKWTDEDKLLAKKRLLHSNSVGRILQILLMSPYSSIYKSHAMARARHRLLQIAFASAKFKLEQDRQPNSLEELVPKYMEAIPTDPFDGKPLRYNSKNRRVYSIGRDLEDSGGIPARPSTKPSYSNRQEPWVSL